MLLSNVQIELLKLFSTDLSEKDISELRDVLVKFYAEKAVALADQVWQQLGYTEDDINFILNNNEQ